jgi:uncharacterized protein with HEPN domain
MSEAPPTREWHFYVQDMLGFCDKVLAYTQGLDRTSFTADSLRYDATLRNLELIGEAATHVPAHIRALHPSVPWRLVVAVRNRLIHGYLGIDDDTLWSIVCDDITPLQSALVQVLATPAT